MKGMNLFSYPKPSQDFHRGTSPYHGGRPLEKKFVFSNFISGVEELGHHRGYHHVPYTKDAMMFYYFFESRNNRDDPVVLWLTGEPGCSSELALFYENGPFYITRSLSLEWNDFGWDKVSNIIYVDNQRGRALATALHRMISGMKTRRGSAMIYSNKILYSKNGLAIGNGLKNPGTQCNADVDHALDMKLINESIYSSMQTIVSDCEQATSLCGTNGNKTCLEAYGVRSQILEEILYISRGINYYDIRKTCQDDICYDLSPADKYLNQYSIKKALGTGDIEFVSCNPDVCQAMAADIMRNLEVEIPGLLEDGIKLLVYAGKYDLICNWLGNLRWVRALKWSGGNEFLAGPTVPFSVDGMEAGVLQSYGPLSFLKVHNAGHPVPMDQPQADLVMLRTWMRGDLSIKDPYLKLNKLSIAC